MNVRVFEHWGFNRVRNHEHQPSTWDLATFLARTISETSGGLLLQEKLSHYLDVVEVSGQDRNL